MARINVAAVPRSFDAIRQFFLVNPRTSVLALHAAVLLFAFAALFGKWLALSPLVIVLGRTLVATLTLAAVMGIRRQRIGGLTAKLAVSGVLLAVHWIAFFSAIRVASVAIGLLGYASFPLFVLLLERRLLARTASAADYAIAALVVAGLALLVPAFAWSSSATRGLALGILAGATFALLAVRNRERVAHQEPAEIALWQNAAAAACLLPLAALGGGLHAWPAASDLALLVVLGAVCTALAHTLFIASMRRVSAHTASVVAALEPVYGIALAAWLLAEVPDLRTLAGGALIVVAALVAGRRAS